MPKKLNIEQFIERSNLVHNNKYDYSLAIYVNTKTNVCIICPEHGLFKQSAGHHLRAVGCNLCGGYRSGLAATKRALKKRPSFSEITPPENSILIPISKDKYTIIDIEDYDRVIKHTLSESIRSNTTYVRFRVKKKSYFLHRFIMNIEDPNILIDHKNNNGLDNRKINLRTANSSENSMNCKGSSNAISIYKGVCFNKKSNKWYSKIASKGKEYHIGTFNNEIDAAKAYDLKAIELHGEFAYLNFKIINKTKNAG